MADVQISKFRANLADYVNRAVYGNERIMVERGGKPLFAIVPVADMRLLAERKKSPKRKS
jgi:prevent-host-death family protein